MKLKPEPVLTVVPRKPPSVLDKDFHYTPSNSTNVGATFARHGFVPPSTLKKGKT